MTDQTPVHGCTIGGEPAMPILISEHTQLITRLAEAEAERDTARATNRRLNLEKQRLESELATYRRAVAQWEVSERGTYIPHASLQAIGKAGGVDLLGTVRHLKHFQRVEQAEDAIERVRELHRKANNGTTCVYCAGMQRIGYDTDWPCDTIRALDTPEPTP